ncbi:hypothetical protein Taro_039052 [Colocasia esculenta]|uniref:Uncharacterized protein n=1 Tax=Colocasia esculenta TaxID=4460 RepID=A0A843WQF7_COLES|nr:hypothetical protein [Colocasia esculenta]
MGRSVAFWLPKAKGFGRLPLPPLSPLLSFPLFSGDGEAPLRRSGHGAAGGWWRGVGAASWSEEVVALRHEGPSWVRIFVTCRDFLCPSRSCWIGSPSEFIDSFTAFPMLPSPSWCDCMGCGWPGIEDPIGLPLCWCRDSSARRDIRGGVGHVGRDLIATPLAVMIRVSCCASRSRQGAVATPLPIATGFAVAVALPVAMVS